MMGGVLTNIKDIKEFTPFCQKYETGFDMEEHLYNDTDSIRMIQTILIQVCF